MGFGFRVSRNVRVSGTRRGLRLGVGPRAARLHFGSGRPTISSGYGPLTVWTGVGGRRRRRRTSTSSGSPVFGIIALLIVVWVLVKLFWPILIALAILAVAAIAGMTARKLNSAAAQGGPPSVALTDQEDEAYCGLTAPDLYGCFPPAVPRPEGVLDIRRRAPLPGPKPALQAELEDQSFQAEARAVEHAGQAAQGRVLLDRFIAEVKQRGIEPETIFEESRGTHTWTFDKVYGEGWILEDFGHERNHYQYLYYIPGKGIVQVVRRLQGTSVIKVLRYGTKADNSDQAFAEWSSRASLLAYQLRLVTRTGQPRRSAARPALARPSSPPLQAPASPSSSPRSSEQWRLEKYRSTTQAVSEAEKKGLDVSSS